MQSDVARWNELFLTCVANAKLDPTITARALQIVHTAIFDTWAAFDSTAIGVNSRIEAPDDLTVPAQYDAALGEAIAWAAYTAATHVFPAHNSMIDAFMVEIGYNPDAPPPEPNSAAAIGKAAAQAVLDYRLSDFANEAGNFSDTTGYTPRNSASPDANNAPGGPDFDPNAWQPLRVPTGEHVRLRISEDTSIKAQPVINDNPASYKDQSALTPQFGEVKAFSLQANHEFRPPPPPRLGDDTTYVDGNGKVTSNDAAYREQVAEVLAISGTLTDEQKAIAEFWADGPRSETPPGHWNQLAQDVAMRDGNSLEDDIKMFFALNNALLDAAIATWEAKYHYDYIRPQSAIQHLYFGDEMTAWLGPNRGVGTMLGQEWKPYQQATFITPAFPEYTSGHSAFSTAAATILQMFTGSDVFFDGSTRGAHDFDGDGELDLAGQYIVSELAFEYYDGLPIELTWETFSEAAEEAGVSRLYGGIHFQDGNLFGLQLGTNVGNSAWTVSQDYVNGSANALLQSPSGTDADDLLIGSGAAESFDAGAGNDIVRPNGGGDVVSLGSGSDRIEGYAAALDGLHVLDLTHGDSISFLDGPDADTVDIVLTADGALIAAGGAEILLDGNFANGRFVFGNEGDATLVTFLPGVRLTVGMLNGEAQTGATIPSAALLSNDGFEDALTESQWAMQFNGPAIVGNDIVFG